VGGAGAIGATSTNAGTTAVRATGAADDGTASGGALQQEQQWQKRRRGSSGSSSSSRGSAVLCGPIRLSSLCVNNVDADP
jgi:hypothetical protein